MLYLLLKVLRNNYNNSELDFHFAIINSGQNNLFISCCLININLFLSLSLTAQFAENFFLLLEVSKTFGTFISKLFSVPRASYFLINLFIMLLCSTQLAERITLLLEICETLVFIFCICFTY